MPMRVLSQFNVTLPAGSHLKKYVFVVAVAGSQERQNTMIIHAGNVPRENVTWPGHSMIEIEQFLNHLQSEDLTPGTLAAYQGNLFLFGQWMTENGLTVATLTQANLRQHREALKEKYKPATINNKLGYIRKFLQWCQENGLIDHNPAIKIKPVKHEKLPRWLTKSQVDAILHAAQKEIETRAGMETYLNISIRGHTIAVLLLNTGLRVSELCDLKLSDICNGVITVRWGKGAKRRQVPMNDHARIAVEEWLKVRQSKTDYLFSTWNGRITRQVVLFHLAEIGKELGFKLTPHLLRHTFGKALADKGIALDRIAKLMGHASVNTTANYTMPSLDDLRRVVETLDGHRID